MEYNVSDLKRDVRVTLDLNKTSTALANLGDVDTLSLDDIIESKIAPAARIVETAAPVYLLDEGEPFGESIGWDSEPGYGSGYVVLPRDFMRLVSFRMSDWDRAVTAAITEDDPLYAQQRSRYVGIRGCPERPVVAIVNRPVGMVLEFYSCTGGPDVFLRRARYLPYPKIIGGAIEICEKLKDAVVCYAGYMSALTVGEGDLAAQLLTMSNELTK